MNLNDKLEMMDMTSASISKAKEAVIKNPDQFIVETFKAWGYIKAVVDSIKQEHGKEPTQDPKA